MREIESNKNFFCMANKCWLEEIPRNTGHHPKCIDDEKTNSHCGYRHRKWPTPEQFQEEYGKPYPNNGAVYTLFSKHSCMWELETYKNARRYEKPLAAIVCACTPYGEPPADWKTENHPATVLTAAYKEEKEELEEQKLILKETMKMQEETQEILTQMSITFGETMMLMHNKLSKANDLPHGNVQYKQGSGIHDNH